MPKTEIILQVFVASPSDVKEERIAIEKVIRELNITWSDTFNIRLDLIKWETHASPGMAEDAQAVINEQIKDTYDIFIAIFWCNLGTPTNRADSGTIEEFNRAYERFKADPDSIEIMLYFKETPIKPSQIDPHQMQEVSNFKSHVRKKALYFEFDSTDSFIELVRNHLNQKIKKWAERYYGKSKTRSTTPSHIEEKIPVADELIEQKEQVEIIENSTQLIERVIFSLNHIIKGIEDLYKKLGKRNTNSKRQNKTNDLTMNEKENSRVVSKASLLLTDFTYRMDFEISLLEESLKKAIEPYINISGKRCEFFNDDSNAVQNALTAVNTLRTVTINSNIKVRKFRKLLEEHLRKEPESYNACHSAFESIDKLLEHLEHGKEQATEVETYLFELL